MSEHDPAYTYKNNKHYKLYNKEKEEIKKKYPPRIFKHTAVSGQNTMSKLTEEYMSGNDRELFNQYLKEIGDLLFQPNGNYQNMIWETMGEKDKLEMERKSRGKIRGTGEYGY